MLENTLFRGVVSNPWYLLSDRLDYRVTSLLNLAWLPCVWGSLWGWVGWFLNA
jgi:hypothetical protein